jgi:hypothetical protein
MDDLAARLIQQHRCKANRVCQAAGLDEDAGMSRDANHPSQHLR